MTRGDALGRGAPVSSQRTYRYVRVSLCAAVLLLGVAIVWHLVTLGPLRSISAAYYTPARSVFVGALFTVALALVVLAGRSVRRYLLLLAGMLAPIIALVPAPPDSGERLGTAADEIAVGMLAYLVGAGAVLAASIVFLALDRALDRWALVRGTIAALLLAALGVWSTQSSFPGAAHYAAAGLFFVLIAVVAGIHAANVRAEGVTGPGSPVLYARSYAVLALLLALTELLLIVLVVTETGERVLGEQWLLIGEAAALALFAAFWVLQTVENWDEPDATAR